MSEKTKSSLKKIVIYLLIFALGITAGVLSVKGSFDYREMRSLSHTMSFRTYTDMMLLDNAFRKGLSYEDIHHYIVELSFIMEFAGRSNNAFLNEEDRKISTDEWVAIVGCIRKAEFISGDLAAGNDVSDEDKAWFEDFGTAVICANRDPQNPSYKLFAEYLIDMGLYEPEEEN